MREEIKELEKQARKLEPSSENRIKLTAKVLQYAHRFLNDLSDKKAFKASERKGKGLLDDPFSEEPGDPDSLLELIEENVDNAGLNPASGGHLGYIPGGGLFPSALGDLLAAVTNRYAGVFFSSPGAVRMENLCIRWMCDLVGYPEGSAGNLTSGGSIANLIAFVTARDHAGLKGSDYERTVIYTTRHVHHCAAKAFKFAGMQDSIIRYVPMDERFRMVPGELEKMIREDRDEGHIPFLVFASAGTTDVGAVDPLDKLADVTESNNLWFHVDAAYGGFFLLTEHGREVMEGIGRADSVIIDPHKGLFLPYGSGALLVKDGQKLYDSQHMTADYMQDTFKATEEPSPADLSPELSKHFRGLRMWLPIKLFGIAPFRAALEEKLHLARYFHREVKKLDGMETGPDPELSVTFFRYIPENGSPDEFNERLVQEIHRDGRVFLSSTRIGGDFYLRLAVLHFRTHIDRIDQTLEILREKIEVLKNRDS